MKYIVGLGNPGSEYKKTRHNIGQDICEKIKDDYGFSDWYEPSHGHFRQSKGIIGDEEVTCVIPMTFMNKSGMAVAHFIKKDSDLIDLIVVHDELDIPEGEVKNTTQRGAGGNNGVDSIIKTLGSKEFARVRVGIGPVDEDGKVIKLKYRGLVSDFVLKPFDSEDVRKEVLEKGTERLLEILKNK